MNKYLIKYKKSYTLLKYFTHLKFIVSSCCLLWLFCSKIDTKLLRMNKYLRQIMKKVFDIIDIDHCTKLSVTIFI